MKLKGFFFLNHFDLGPDVLKNNASHLVICEESTHSFYPRVVHVLFVICIYYILSIFCMTNMTGSKLSIFSHTGKITGYWITTRSFPYRGPYWLGPIWGSTSSQANMGVSFLDVGSM